MLLTRRAVGVAIAAGMGALATGAAWRKWHRRASFPIPSHGPTGTLEDSTLAALMIAARTITGVDDLKGHYAGYYAYQALHRPGYLGVYRDFATALQHQLRNQPIQAFARESSDRRWSKLEDVNRAPDSIRYVIPIVEETIAIFLRTDAWLLMGYEGWAGTARGLENYRHPPSRMPS